MGALTILKKRKNRLFPPAGETRGVGKSTALALSFISQAILKPNDWIVVIDHVDRPELNKALMFMCRELVRDMELKFFAYEYSRASGRARIRCDIFEVAP
jgi:hypothetical protein